MGLLHAADHPNIPPDFQVGDIASRHLDIAKVRESRWMSRNSHLWLFGVWASLETHLTTLEAAKSRSCLPLAGFRDRHFLPSKADEPSSGASPDFRVNGMEKKHYSRHCNGARM
jgi:hypothetical protein